MYRRMTQIPSDLLAKAKRLNPSAIIPNKSGQGVVVSSYFMRDVNLDDLFYFAIARGYDGKLYLIHHIVPRPLSDTLPNIILQSPFLFMEWNEKGAITEWTAGQPK
ncbi:hypothetical protein R9X47_03310 [Wukongibacter baidiensis]|uniref:hypothetical protein n=1 Tax=Wukongibacter baidiensis TaxID=1723361 RepID=UPI003D7F7FC4